MKLTAADALDNLGIAGVQFKVDGSPVGPEVTEDPYTTIWDTTGVRAGQHMITAVARDAAGNLGTSPGVVVNLSGMDVQIENGTGTRSASPTPATRSRIPSGDRSTRTRSRSAGAASSPRAAPRRRRPAASRSGSSPTTATTRSGTDSIVLYKDPQRTATDPLNQKLTSLGSLDLAVDTYVGRDHELPPFADGARQRRDRRKGHARRGLDGGLAVQRTSAR